MILILEWCAWRTWDRACPGLIREHVVGTVPPTLPLVPFVYLARPLPLPTVICEEASKRIGRDVLRKLENRYALPMLQPVKSGSPNATKQRPTTCTYFCPNQTNRSALRNKAHAVPFEYWKPFHSYVVVPVKPLKWRHEKDNIQNRIHLFNIILGHFLSRAKEWS